MNKISTIIVEDEKEDLELLENLLQGFNALEIIDKASTIEKAAVAIAVKKPQLLFLDIELHRRNSLALVQELLNYNVTPQIIFTTAHKEYAISVLNAFKNLTVYYLVKPIDREELKIAVEKNIKYIKEKITEKSTAEVIGLNNYKTLFKTEEGFITINPAEVVYIEPASKGESYSFIWLKKNSPELICKSIGYVEKKLLADYLLRINRSTIININYLWRVNKNHKKCYLEKNGEIFEINISYKKALELAKHIQQKMQKNRNSNA